MATGLAAIMFGQSLIKTLQGQLIEKATGSITGHIQVQNRHIKEYKFPDRYVEDPGPPAAALSGHPDIFAWGRRITITGLVSSPTGSVGVLICAVEPTLEPKITTMASYITRGDFLLSHRKGIVMGEKLAQRLDLKLGEKAVIMAQASDGSMGAEALRLTGVYRTGSTSFDGQIVYVPLDAAQEMLVVGKRVNQLVARLKDVGDADQVKRDLAEALGSQGAGAAVQVLSWKDVDHEILAIQRFQDALLTVVLIIVFLIVALGVLNTMLMSLFERVREFGVLMAIGARPAWVLRLVLAESAALGLVGAVLGLALGSALIAYFGRNGLHLPVGEALAYFIPFPSVLYLQPSWKSHVVATASVLVTSLLAALPPALRACRLRPAEALRHV